MRGASALAVEQTRAVFSHVHPPAGKGDAARFDSEKLVGGLPASASDHYKISDCGMKSFPIEALSHEALYGALHRYFVSERNLVLDNDMKNRVHLFIREANTRTSVIVLRKVNALCFIDREPFTRVGDLIHRPPAVVFADMSLREAADHMVREEVGRLPVVDRSDPSRVVGILTRSDLLSAHAQRLDEALR